MLRRCIIGLSVLTLLVAGSPPASATTYGRVDGIPNASSCVSKLDPSLVPPPNPAKLRAPSLSGRTDLSVGFRPGWIRVRVACGHTITEIMQKHQLNGIATNWSPPPFDDHDLRAGIDRSFRITVTPGLEKQLVSRLAAQTADFDWVQLDWQFPVALAARPPVGPRSFAFVPSDPRLGSQSNLTRANFQRAWDRTVSFSAVTIAVLDSGLRATHEDAGQWKQKRGYDYVRNIETPAGTAIDTGCWGGHGTHVATIAAADTNNGKGVAGAGFNSGLLPMRVLNGSLCDIWAASTRDWPIRWARLNGAHIVNMSYYFAGPDPDEEYVMWESWYAGTTPVAAASNQGKKLEDSPAYPCMYAYVVCVGANTDTGARCSVSSYSQSYVDFSAPSGTAWGAGSASNTSYIFDNCHTSYAAPLVSGAMALLRSLGYGPQEQYNALAATASLNNWTIFGEINAGAALWR
jgi:subtilisin family serine protease